MHDELSSDAAAILEKAYFSDHPDEEEVLARLPELLRDCRHFVDIGASLGQYAFQASRIMQNGRIDAFEADPGRAARLTRSCSEWEAQTTNRISVHQLAVAKAPGNVTFYSTHSNVSGGLFPNDLAHLDEATRARTKWTTVDVNAVSLDGFYSEATPDFIKMDIEGAEGEALLGATRLLQKRQTRWLIELHGFEQGWQPRQVIDFMRSHRYYETELAPSRVLFTPASWVEHVTRVLSARLREGRHRLRATAGRVARRLIRGVRSGTK